MSFVLNGKLIMDMVSRVLAYKASCLSDSGNFALSCSLTETGSLLQNWPIFTVGGHYL